MIIKTAEFQEAANKILLAAELDSSAANLELHVKDTTLKLAVTNKEYYVAVYFPLEQPDNFRAVVDASLFLNLISGISTETFELSIDNNVVIVKAGKSSYKLAMIYENDKLMELPIIVINNKTVTMPVKNEVLASILNVNSRELQKAKKLDVNELQRLYYIDETGCFTFTTGACLNQFTLDQPIKLLLNERIVKLFKLFKDNDITLNFGYDADADGTARPKVSFEAGGVYMAARINCDDVLINKIMGPCNATKNFIKETYSNNLVISSNLLAAAISRLILFTKNSVSKANTSFVLGTVTFTDNEFTITDDAGNVEVVTIENGSTVDAGYSMRINLADLKSVLDSCKNEHITLCCGNHRSVIINRGPISNVIPEARA